MLPTILVDENGEKVNWLKVKCLQYLPTGKILFKYDHNDVFKVNNNVAESLEIFVSN